MFCAILTTGTTRSDFLRPIISLIGPHMRTVKIAGICAEASIINHQSVAS